MLPNRSAGAGGFGKSGISLSLSPSFSRSLATIRVTSLFPQFPKSIALDYAILFVCLKVLGRHVALEASITRPIPGQTFIITVLRPETLRNISEQQGTHGKH